MFCNTEHLFHYCSVLSCFQHDFSSYTNQPFWGRYSYHGSFRFMGVSSFLLSPNRIIESSCNNSKSIFCLLKSQVNSNRSSETRSVVSDTLRPHGLYTVHGILQARILEWVAVPFSRGSSQPRDRIQVFHIAGGKRKTPNI